MFGDGGQTRDFVFVADVVEALAAALDPSNGNGREAELEVLNVARGQSVSLLDLLDAVARLEGIPGIARVEHGPARQGDVRHSLANVGRLETAYGWSARTSLEEGLARTVAAIVSESGADASVADASGTEAPGTETSSANTSDTDTNPSQ